MPIQLPALGIQAPQQTDILGQAAKLRQFQAMGQEQQLRDQTLKSNALDIQQKERDARDSQAMTSAMQEWDGKNPDDLPGLLIKNKASAKAVFGMKSSILEQKKTYAQIAKDDAETGKNTMQALAEKHDMLAGAVHNVLTMPDDQIAAGAQQTIQQAVSNKLMSPEEAQQYAPLAQLPPPQLRQQLSFMEKHFMGDKAQREAVTQQETARHNQAVEKHDAAMEEPAAEKEFQDYYKSYLGAKKQQPSAASELAARQQYFKDKQPYGAQRIEIARENLNQREQSADRKDTDFIDKNYVKPANDAEKSYQMFMEAYNNRNNAKTGAESMLALSTHLATTFGNVKGARVTKDMIQEHLGARGISDSALVAVQKLTNGDVLSPDQWDAFKGLISNSRKLSWETAKKEADRRSVDIKGSLPADLSGVKSSTAAQPASDFFSKFGGKSK